MSDIGAEAFNALYNEIPDGRCSIRIKQRKVLSTAWTSGLEIARINSDEGQIDTLTGDVRFLASAEPALGQTVKVGDTIQIKQDHDATYQDARVAGRYQKAGAVRLVLGAEFDT